MGFIIFIIWIIAIFLSVSRILPIILSWYFVYKFRIPIRIRKISVLNFKLCDIEISNNALNVVHIQEVGIKSSFFNSELTKLITLVVKNVRIVKRPGHEKSSNERRTKRNETNISDFRNKKVPNFINTLAQFMAVHVYNIKAFVQLNTECILEVWLKDLHIDGSILKNAKSLLATLNVTDAFMSVLKSNSLNQHKTKVAAFSFGITMETVLVAQGPLSVEKLEIKMSHSKASIKNGFYQLLHGPDEKYRTVIESLPTAINSDQSWSPYSTRTFESKSFAELQQYLQQNLEPTDPNPNNDFLKYILPIVPKNFSLQIDDTSFKGYNTSEDIEGTAALKSLSMNYRSVSPATTNGMLFNFYLNDFALYNNHEKVAELKNVSIDAKFKNDVLNIYLQQNSLLITYNHSVIFNWIKRNLWMPQSKRQGNKQTQPGKTDYLIQYYMLEELLKNISINFCAELSNVVFVVILKAGLSSSIGVNRLRLMLDQVQERKSTKYDSLLANVLLGDRHWQSELLIESLCWSFKEWNYSSNISKVMHLWDTPVYVGMSLIKFCTSENKEFKLYAMLDTVQLEWSAKLADYILLALNFIRSYEIQFKTILNSQPSKPQSKSKIITSVVIYHFDCFFQSQHNENSSEYFVSRLDTVNLDNQGNLWTFKLDELKIFTLFNTGGYYTCIRTEDIIKHKVYVKNAELEFSKTDDSLEYNISLSENNRVYWSTNFHLKCLLLYRDLQEFIKQITESSDKLKKKPVIVDYSTLPAKVINFTICRKFELHIDISKDHNMKIVLDELLFSNSSHASQERKKTNHILKTLTVAIDGADIFELKGILMKRLFKDQLQAQKFLFDKKMAGLSEGFNDCSYLLEIDAFKAVFPHEHNYAEAVQNQFLSIVKWLKIIHKDTLRTKTCPPDWFVKVKDFLFEMSDDPFEIKLRDNFELLEDEFSESLKRQKVLKEKIAELLKTHLHMPAGKVEELYATLKKRNADIYIQRSKLMYQAAPQRTRLFAWNMTNIECSVMMENYDVVHISEYLLLINLMISLDKDSPLPDVDLEFSTSFCRDIILGCEEWKFQLRDFPQPLLEIKKIYLFGKLGVAEQVAPKRATRTVMVDLGDSFEPFEVERGMQPLKFYYDLNCEIESFSYAFGPCWEPVIAQCNLSFNQISAPSRDPSPPLPFWDKMRLLMHGRLTMLVQKMQVLLHASLDPYNTTEEMALTWEKVIMDWTNAKIVFKGDLNIFVRTASKYDDVQLLKLPNLNLILGFHWVCLADPNDHHNVIYCAPDKIPEYSSNQVHDSFRAFRSQSLNMSIVLETVPGSDQFNNCPILLLYGSTLRWIESLKLILSGVTRPTRRGKIFGNLKPKKTQLSRHYKKINLLIGLHKFQVCYWMSFAMHRGCEMFGGRLASSSEHSLTLVTTDDGLTHRAKAEWSIVYMNSELADSEIWLKSALQDESEFETSRLQPIEKTYCLSVAKVSYGREAVLPNQSIADRIKDTPTHRLVVYDLRGAWTKSNRNVALALFDTFMKTTRMKKNLSTEALKGFRKDTNTTPMKKRGADPTSTPPNNAVQSIQAASAVQDTPSPISKLQSGHAANMLQQLIAEVDNNSIVYSDDLSAVSRQQHLQGVQACQGDDVIHKNWQISLVNAQVLLKGCETNGYIILSAAKAEILQRAHRPAWKDRTLVSKTTWTGLLECMQYYATVNAGENDPNENIMWLTVDNIQEKESAEISEPSEVPNMVGSGVSVGAVVSDTVGPSTSRQLQRIVSRCKCEFYYASYGDISVDPEGIGEIPSPPQEDVSLWDSRESGVDAFTLMHYDLDVCTNSLQYGMLLDIINNLLLYVEPHRKEALEKLARMRFQLQLHSVEDQRRPIQEKQTIVRNTINKLRRLEKDTYMLNKALDDDPDDKDLRVELERLERLMHDCKMNLNAQSEELDMMISCYKETQLLANSRMATTRSDKPLTIVRANEICFKHAQWRLTEADGQIGIADLVLSNFLYTKNSKSDDSVEHLLELGYLRMTNLLPNEIYKEILCPTEIQFDMPIEHKKVLRIFCREKPPVGGISVKEHFEINLVPLTIGLTKKFYNTMMKFCFPERDTEVLDYNDRASEDGDSELQKSKKGKSKKSRDSNFYVHIDDVEKMKERAEKNKLFVFTKIPEVPVKVSYKGNKEKNLEDLRDVSIVIPTLEYHNMTWTWLDLLIAIRNDTKKVILSQAIKQKLQIKRNTGTSEDSSAPQEEDKAKMLLGSRHAPENKSIRKGLSEVFKL
ncbi:protein KIAA0100 isoform X2 [Dendroctonus ponderosae]|uniref:protein KIAA0100 isoform X2 n=1 Tax=Dendroctonus ponderosae TaxID=77166 RepID=UPI002035370C|nr:protein KIAA0100 isoform X2 [Dendroctonus ponderosae]